jgi:hypothetical protein
MLAMRTAASISYGTSWTAVMLVASVLSVAAQDPYFGSTPGFLNAVGKWRPADKSTAELAAKHQVEIQCRLNIKVCVEAYANIANGEPEVSLQVYRIIEWNKDSIIAEDDSPVCTTNRLLISFQEQSIRAIDMPKKSARGLPIGDGKNACQLANQTQTYKLVSP